MCIKISLYSKAFYNSMTWKKKHIILKLLVCSVLFRFCWQWYIPLPWNSPGSRKSDQQMYLWPSLSIFVHGCFCSWEYWPENLRQYSLNFFLPQNHLRSSYLMHFHQYTTVALSFAACCEVQPLQVLWWQLIRWKHHCSCKHTKTTAPNTNYIFTDSSHPR